eukprot:scaffold99476_cov15-Tisochrysis_lutea.AAC.1
MFVLEKLEVSAGLHTQDSTQVSDATPIEATFHALPGELILGRQGCLRALQLFRKTQTAMQRWGCALGLPVPCLLRDLCL